MPRLWDPASGSPSGAPMVQVDTMLFCSGHALMADGRLMISGGHKADGEGLDITTIFDPAGESFIQNLPKMAFGRWYPTVTELTDGRMLTMAGQDSDRQRGDDAGDLGGQSLGRAAGRRDAADPVLPAQLHRPEERARLHGRRADRVALVRPGRDRRGGGRGQLDQRAVAHLAVQPGLRLGRHVRAGQDPGRRRRRRHRLGHAGREVGGRPPPRRRRSTSTPPRPRGRAPARCRPRAGT